MALALSLVARPQPQGSFFSEWHAYLLHRPAPLRAALTTLSVARAASAAVSVLSKCTLHDDCCSLQAAGRQRTNVSFPQPPVHRAPCGVLGEAQPLRQQR